MRGESAASQRAGSAATDLPCDLVQRRGVSVVKFAIAGLPSPRSKGKAIARSLPLGHIIDRRALENLDPIPTGALPPNRTEFLQHVTFSNLLAEVSSQYDLVVIDPPPILAVSDVLVIGAHVGEITASVMRLNHAGTSSQDVAFNDLPLRPGGDCYRLTFGHVAQLGMGDRPLK